MSDFTPPGSAQQTTAVTMFPSRRKLAQARTILRGTGADRSDRDTLRDLWRLLLPDECGQDGSEEHARS